MSAHAALVDAPITALPEAPPDRDPEITVLVSARRTDESLVDLYEEFAAPLRADGSGYEFLFLVNRDSIHVQLLLGLVARGEPIRVFYAETSVSETLLLRAAVQQSRGDILVVLPPRRRIVASGVSELIARVRAGADAAVARRSPRRFSRAGRLRSAVFHFLLRRVTGRRLNDLACGVRVIRRRMLDEVPLYGEFSSYLPLLALRDGFRVEEVPLPQHPSDRGGGFQGPPMYMRRLVDLLNLFFLLRFAEKPLRFFGLMGALSAAAGAILLAVLFVQRIGGQPLGNRPLLLFALLLVVLGVQSLSLGLIGEVIVHMHAPRRRPYRLARGAAPESAARTHRTGLEDDNNKGQGF